MDWIALQLSLCRKESVSANERVQAWAQYAALCNILLKRLYQMKLKGTFRALEPFHAWQVRPVKNEPAPSPTKPIASRHLSNATRLLSSII